MCGSDIFLGVLAVFFPPVAVWIKVGICTADSIINLALCCLGYVPGLLHAWYIILKNPEPDYDSVVYEPISRSGGQGGDVENGRPRYYYVSRDQLQHPSQRGYGTVQSPHSQPSQPLPKHQQPQPQPQQNNDGSGGSSSQGQDDSRAPPTYAEAVRGDNKVQTQDE